MCKSGAYVGCMAHSHRVARVTVWDKDWCVVRPRVMRTLARIRMSIFCRRAQRTSLCVLGTRLLGDMTRNTMVRSGTQRLEAHVWECRYRARCVH